MLPFASLAVRGSIAASALIVAACASSAGPAARPAAAGPSPAAPDTEIIDDFVPEPRVSAALLARQCPREDYSLDDADAAACFYYINAIVDAIIVTGLPTVTEKCRQIVAARPTASINEIRLGILESEAEDTPAIPLIIELVKNRICGG
jgi:hypothetical protein